MANPPAGRRQPGGVAPAAPKAPGGGGRGKLSGMGQAGDGGRGGPPPGVAMPGQGGGIMGGMMGGMAGGKMGLGNLSASTGTETEDDLNLVELAVYGLGSIYERFPAKDKDKDAVVTATPTTPPAAAK